MSANRDPSQKFHFLFNKAKLENPEHSSQPVRILKKKEVGATAVAGAPSIYFLPTMNTSVAPAVESLKKNLSALQNLQQRFKFLLKEIQEVDSALADSGIDSESSDPEKS